MPHKDRERSLEYHREWYAKNRESQRARTRRYREANLDKERERARRKSRGKIRNEKVLAREAVNAEIRRGRLEKGSCELLSDECEGRIEAHHDDYSKPLDVRWLCRHHHALHHTKDNNGLH